MRTEEVPNEGANDSNAMRHLRQELKAAQARAKQAENERDSLIAETENRVRRDISLDSHLTALGMPLSIRLLVADELGDSEVTRESVEDALSGLGFDLSPPAPASHSQVSDDGGEPVRNDSLARALEGVASLGAQVANIAQSGVSDNLTTRINNAQTPAELAEIMSEAGMSQ